MNIQTLPIPLGSLSYQDELVIDMSSPHFPTKPELQIQSSIIFIRNTNLNAKFDFSKCSYSTKAEYLLIYMTKYFRVIIPEITSTWVKIIANKYGSADCESILTDDELTRFISENTKLVNELINITGSIPIYAIDSFIKSNNINIPQDAEKTDYCEINGYNYFQMLDVDNFINLIQIIDDVSPKFYTNYFIPGNDIMSKVMNRLPYAALMGIMFCSGTDSENAFCDMIDNMINKKCE